MFIMHFFFWLHPPQPQKRKDIMGNYEIPCDFSRPLKFKDYPRLHLIFHIAFNMFNTQRQVLAVVTRATFTLHQRLSEDLITRCQ